MGTRQENSEPSGPWLLIGLWSAAAVVPLGILPVCPWAGVGLGIALPAIYLLLAPKTCLGGGGIMGCPMAMGQLAFLIAWGAQAIRLLARHVH